MFDEVPDLLFKTPYGPECTGSTLFLVAALRTRFPLQTRARGYFIESVGREIGKARFHPDLTIDTASRLYVENRSDIRNIEAPPVAKTTAQER